MNNNMDQTFKPRPSILNPYNKIFHRKRYQIPIRILSPTDDKLKHQKEQIRQPFSF